MRKITIDQIGRQLAELIQEQNPVEEDIGIFDRNANLSGVVIKKDAYEFFLKQVDQAETEQDLADCEEFLKSSERNAG